MHNIVSRVTTGAAAVLTLAGLGIASAGAASAAPHSHSVTAVTRMIDRPDGGHGGDWALDNFVRVATVTSLGSALAVNCDGATPCYAYRASLSDGNGTQGTFTTILGAGTPNQSGPYAGEHITGALTGKMYGSGEFATFYSTARPDASLVPHSEVGHIHDSGQWPALFFPADSTFGISEVTYDYNYSIVGFGRIVRSQHWEDSSSNGDGDLPGDGNITG